MQGNNAQMSKEAREGEKKGQTNLVGNEVEEGSVGGWSCRLRRDNYEMKEKEIRRKRSGSK